MAAGKIIFALGIIAAVGALPLQEEGSASSEVKTKEIRYRLPDNVKPLHYELALWPYMTENFTFDGTVAINIEILSPTQDIVLHKDELDIHEDFTMLIQESDSNVFVFVPSSHEYDESTEQLTLHFNVNLQPRLYKLLLKFTGILNEDLYGFYRCPYKDEDGTQRWIATTHFEPTSARRAFPCFDEPALKATFNISIQHHSNYTALSNMPVLKRSADDDESDRVWTKFQKTPMMSTYLVAFVVGDLVNISSPDGMTNIWTRRGVIDKGEFILKVAEVATHALEEYTNSSFRMPKMDHVAVTRFPAGAMENWGLIIYPEGSLLYDNSMGIRRKIRVAEVAVHELAHQWFGNVVSPAWWSYTWLNEAFAAYFQRYIVDQISDLDWTHYFVVTTLQETLQGDSTPYSQPIMIEVKSTSDAMSAFSSITYDKGASVLRMLSYAISADVFRNGLIKYINTYEYKAATPSDLWSSIQSVLDESDIPHDEFTVAEAMNTWTDQMGYPLVTVHRDYESGKAILTQNVFRQRWLDSWYTEDDSEEETSKDEKESSKWWVPVSYTTATDADFSNTLPSVWLRPDEHNKTIDGLNENDWIIVNLQETGFYRVNYDAENWRKIAKYLDSDNYKNIHHVNRAQIMDDAFILLQQGLISPVIYMELCNYLSRESDIIVWIPVFRALHRFKQYILNSSGSDVFKPHVLGLMEALIESVGFEERPDEDSLVTMQRPKIIKWACKLGSTACRNYAAEKSLAYMEDPENMSPNMKSFVLCEGLRGANDTVWNNLLNLVHEQGDKYDESLYAAFWCVENKVAIEHVVNLVLTTDMLELSHAMFEGSPVFFTRNPVAVNIIMDYIIENCNELESMKENRTNVRKIVIDMLSSNVYSSQELAKARTLFSACNIEYDEEVLSDVEKKITEDEREVSKILNWFHEATARQNAT